MIKVDRLEFKGIRYLLFYPKNYVEGKKYPVMFHLHGAGSRGNDFAQFEGSSSTIFSIIQKEDSPLSNGFAVIPQCHEDTWFSIFGELMDFAKYIYNRPFTDQSRFNGSGISMGGYGIYQLMMCLPELFHRAIVCCGGGMYWNSGRLKDIGFRIFHGENDGAVFPEESKRMYARLKEAGADVSLTLYPNCEHNCWDLTYTNYDNLKWLFE